MWLFHRLTAVHNVCCGRKNIRLLQDFDEKLLLSSHLSEYLHVEGERLIDKDSGKCS